VPSDSEDDCPADFDLWAYLEPFKHGRQGGLAGSVVEPDRGAPGADSVVARARIFCVRYSNCGPELSIALDELVYSDRERLKRRFALCARCADFALDSTHSPVCCLSVEVFALVYGNVPTVDDDFVSAALTCPSRSVQLDTVWRLQAVRIECQHSAQMRQTASEDTAPPVRRDVDCVMVFLGQPPFKSTRIGVSVVRHFDPVRDFICLGRKADSEAVAACCAIAHYGVCGITHSVSANSVQTLQWGSGWQQDRCSPSSAFKSRWDVTQASSRVFEDPVPTPLLNLAANGQYVIDISGAARIARLSKRCARLGLLV